MSPARAALALLFLTTACAVTPPPEAVQPLVIVEPEPTKAPPPKQPATEIEAERPAGYVELAVATIAPAHGGRAVLLAAKDGSIAVPIFIGGTEALAIELRSNKKRFTRPLTHDLLDAITKELGGRLVKVHIDAIRDDTFVGAVFVQQGDRLIELDARPSDAIALAVGNRVPIFVAQQVLDRAGITPDRLRGQPKDPGSGAI